MTPVLVALMILIIFPLASATKASPFYPLIKGDLAIFPRFLGNTALCVKYAGPFTTESPSDLGWVCMLILGTPATHPPV